MTCKEKKYLTNDLAYCAKKEPVFVMVVFKMFNNQISLYFDKKMLTVKYLFFKVISYDIQGKQALK